MRCKSIFFLFAFLFAHVLTGCASTQYIPEEGVWYCDELEIQLSFENSAVSYITENGQQIIGICENDRGSQWVSILCQRNYGSGFYVGMELFCAKIVSLDETVLVVHYAETDQEYVFHRIA